MEGRVALPSGKLIEESVLVTRGCYHEHAPPVRVTDTGHDRSDQLKLLPLVNYELFK